MGTGKASGPALQAHLFKKSPFGDLELQNGLHKKNSVAKKKKT